MVEPGIHYLDVVTSIRREARFSFALVVSSCIYASIYSVFILNLQLPNHPLAVYHVSGEYAMLKAGANAGCINLKSAALEILISFRRAGEFKQKA